MESLVDNYFTDFNSFRVNSPLYFITFQHSWRPAADDEEASKRGVFMTSIYDETFLRK